MTDDTGSVQLGDAISPVAAIRVFLLAEVRDFTRFSQERGDEDATRLVQRFAAVAREVLEARGGKVIEFRGDEALAVFTGARAALRAAVELQERYVDETQRDPSIPLRVGIGLDVGEAIPFEGGYRGRALNLAARLKDQARAGQVLATEGLIHVAGNTPGLTYVALGMIHPKGFDVPVHIAEVITEGQGESSAEPLAEPEMRTFLFGDMVGYVNFAMQHSDTDNILVRTRYSSMLEEHVRAHGGRVLEVRGDEAFAVFLSPRNAIRAALEIQRRFEQVVALGDSVPLSLKVGIETGEAIPFRGSYSGLPVFLAAKICNTAQPGEVLIGETLAQLVRRAKDIRLTDRGQVAVKGFDHPLQIMVAEDLQDLERDEGCDAPEPSKWS